MKSSRIIKLKSRFFIYRLVTYFSFLLFPIWVQKSVELNQGLQAVVMLFYISFMLSQWYMLGKEIDHRLKIYFRVNSSIDRVIYRFVIGNIVMIIYFGLLSFLPHYILKHFFWGTWVVLGLFYSWPTRGKIIQESLSSQMHEFRFLDSFEKTVLGMIILLFLVSLPELPKLENIEALKLFFDPGEHFHPQIWNFLSVNYFPFKKFPQLYRLSWCMHFYVVGMGIYLMAFYALLRVFISRRLSILGIFALVSSWSFSKLLAHDFSYSMTTTYSVLWVWALLWATKSSTYRSGLFIGLLNYYGTIFGIANIILLPVQLGMLYFIFLSNKTQWFRRQLLKYALFGSSLALLTAFAHYDSFSRLSSLTFNGFWNELSDLVDRKGFYILSFIGVLIVLAYYLERYIKPLGQFFKHISFDRTKMNVLTYSYLALAIAALLVDENMNRSFALMWPVVLFSLLPLEWIFQSISRLRSQRNMIYVAYILICLLDSHFEGRVKIVAKLFH